MCLPLVVIRTIKASRNTGGMIDTLIIPRHVAFLLRAGFGMLRVHAGGNSARKLVFRGGEPEMSIFWRARLWQINVCSALIKRLSRIPFLFAVFRRVRELPGVRSMLNAVAGYQRPFPTFADAAAAIAGDEGGGHSHSYYIERTFRNAKKARPSDYPALFHLQRLLPQIRTVFDLAGGVGNAFYCYSKYIDMPAGLSWRILERPEQTGSGKNLPSNATRPGCTTRRNRTRQRGLTS